METVTKTTFGKIMKAAAIAGLISVAINAILYYASKSAGIITMDALANGQPITIIHVIISSLLTSIVAGLVYGLINRFATNPLKTFTIIGLVLLVLTFANPFSIQNISAGMIVVLNIMHVVVFAAVYYLFKRA